MSRKKTTLKWKTEFDDALLKAGYRHHYEFADALGWGEGALSRFYNGRDEFPGRLVANASSILGINGDDAQRLLRISEPAEVA